VEQGGVQAGRKKVMEFSACFSADDLSKDGIIIKKGKKNFFRVVLK
jgi:tyrosyl-tRNA synthetase